jgi:DNA-binding response OmpR family regulator
LAKRILLVDDNEDLRYSIIERMKVVAPAFEIMGAESGSKAISLLQAERVDAVLLDIMMPDMDGWDVAAKLKSDKELKDVPILFLTAKTDETSKNIGKAVAEDYIEKPVRVDELKKRIEQVIGR